MGVAMTSYLLTMSGAALGALNLYVGIAHDSMFNIGIGAILLAQAALCGAYTVRQMHD